MIIRPRRLRNSPLTRQLVRETRISRDALIYPLFVQEGYDIQSPIAKLEGQFHYSPDRVSEAVEACLQVGVRKFLLFGVPQTKDATGSQAHCENGVVQQALRTLRQNFGDDVLLIADTCLCQYTDHGHCGILDGNRIDNDRSIAQLALTAVSQAMAGADFVAPSDMMDGRVAAIRAALDKHDRTDTGIMSYAVKYASSFYGPFREVANSAPSFGDRRGYQMDYHNQNEARKEIRLDTEEGADILIVKPAMCYLDVIANAARETLLPLAAYNVSGEYAMIKAAAKLELGDEYAMMCEMAVAIFRAGANILISYFAPQIAEAITRGDIG